jgi:hypothetical protein
MEKIYYLRECSMERRLFFLCLLSFLLFAEAVSWLTAGGLGPCLIKPEHGQQSANDNEHKDCPTFFTGSLIVFERGFDWVKHDDNDKAVVAGFTIVLAISTIGLWFATNALWRAGEKQFGLLSETAASQSRDMQESIRVSTEYARAAVLAAEVAEKQLILADRPWIDFHVATTGDLKFFEDKCEIGLEISVRNVGRTPAFKVKYSLEMLGSFNAASGRHRQLIARAKDTQLSSSGATIFPNEKVAEELWWWEVSRSDFEAGAKEEDDGSVRLFIVGFAIYQIPSSREPKHTSFFKQIILPGVKPFVTTAGTIYRSGEWKFLGTGFSEAS